MTAPPELLTPTSPAEAAAAFGDGAGVTVMGGGTILLPELTYGKLRPTRVLMTGRAGLSGVDSSNGVVHIGAATPVGALDGTPEPLVTAAKHVADGEIRAVGTIGGNLCATAGGSAPRGDLQAPLLALGARITSVGAGGEKTEDVEAFLDERFRAARALHRRAVGPTVRLCPARPPAHAPLHDARRDRGARRRRRSRRGVGRR